MGNSQYKQQKRSELPPNPMLQKNYSCYYHKITSFPEGMEFKKCTVRDHSIDKKLYTLEDDKERGKYYTMIPYIYVSSYSRPYTWDDYFKAGTIVRTSIPSLSHDNTSRRAEVIKVNKEKDGRTTMDLKDVKTGFSVYGVSCANILFDVGFYKDW